jgi:hypothetical protein
MTEVLRLRRTKRISREAGKGEENEVKSGLSKLSCIDSKNTAKMKAIVNG